MGGTETLCFTLGFAKSIAQARQLVDHGHVAAVNKKVVRVLSFQRCLDDVSVKEKSFSKNLADDNF
jgi:ribosomal protein S4